MSFLDLNLHLNQTASDWDWIAIYGAGLSTLVFLWNLIQYFRNKGRLKIKWLVTSSVLELYGSIKQHMLAINAINVGTKPVIIEKAWIALEDGTEHLIHAPHLPKTKLDHTDFVTISISDLKNLLNLKAIYLQTTLGEIKKIKGREVKKIKEKIGALLAIKE